MLLRIIAAHNAWMKGSKEIAELMLMTMELEIQRNLENLHANDMLKELKTLFAQQADQELLKTTQNYHSMQDRRRLTKKGRKLHMHVILQETKWKGSRNREGNQYKLWYSGSANARNGVGVALAPNLKDKVVQVIRISDRIMLVRLVIEEETINVISAYAPQVGLGEAEKKSFWDSLDDLTAEDFRARVIEAVTSKEENRLVDAEQMCNRLANMIREAAKETLGVVLISLRGKDEANRSAVKERYKEAKREAKKAVARAKEKAYEDLYKRLDSKEGENNIYKIAKARDRRKKGFRNQGLNERLEQWRKALEDNGLQVSREKTEYLRCNFSRNENDRNEEEEIRIGEHILEPKESFRYLGSVIHKSGRIEDDVTHRIQVGWLKWRAATRILYDKKVPLKLKGKFYRVAIQPAMLYGSECWSLTKVQANRMEVAKMRMEVTEIRMLRRTCGKTILDMIPNGVF
ncbi:ataxia telangiectasia mutated family protein [Tanacetum coccineum]